MAGDQTTFFKKTVQHLARSLANIKPTPWDKVPFIQLNLMISSVILHPLYSCQKSMKSNVFKYLR